MFLEKLPEPMLPRARWAVTARPPQLPPDGDWTTWYIRGGRGSGKTRTGAETLADWVLGTPPGDWAIVAPTYGDARDTCVEGPSGVMEALGPAAEQWNRSLGELRVSNGSWVHIDGADDGALRIQGKNLRGAWCDEVGLWRRWETAWEESLAFAVRLEPARIVATGTPKAGHGLVQRLFADERVVKTGMRTLDNLANLSEQAVQALIARYEGTRLGRQELEGELIDEVEGALWTRALIEDCRRDEHPDLSRVVVGVDPSGGAGEQGIVVAGLGVDGHGYVLADRSCRLSPDGWARRAVQAYDDYRADRVVAERNYGGDMVESNLRTVRPTLPVEMVTATRGKQVRAEPVAALYEQGRVRHVGAHPELEDQLTTWCPADGWSPDRLDALVWAITELMVTPQEQTGVVEWYDPVTIGADL